MRLRSAPASFFYVALLGVTTAVLELSSKSTADRLLLELSTNLHQLGRVPVRVLVASAFWVPGLMQFLLWATPSCSSAPGSNGGPVRGGRSRSSRPATSAPRC